MTASCRETDPLHKKAAPRGSAETTNGKNHHWTQTISAATAESAVRTVLLQTRQPFVCSFKAAYRFRSSWQQAKLAHRDVAPPCWSTWQVKEDVNKWEMNQKNNKKTSKTLFKLCRISCKHFLFAVYMCIQMTVTGSLLYWRKLKNVTFPRQVLNMNELSFF